MQEFVSENQDRAALEKQVLKIIGQLLNEIHTNESYQTVGLNDSLEYDLGISSLERVELLLRLERTFSVRLGDASTVNDDSPQDLVTAILRSEPTGIETIPAIQTKISAATQAPASAQTLIDVLWWHAQLHPDRTHIFLQQENNQETPITYGDLWKNANVVATGLRERGLEKGETVAIMLRTEEAFFFVFFGTLLAGGIPVPMYPPIRADRIEEYVTRQVAILKNARARMMVTFDQAERVTNLLRDLVPSITATITIKELIESSPVSEGRITSTPHRISQIKLAANDPALIQYTSGSTGAPKGVLLSHSNLLSNIRAISESLRITPDDVGVSWLPLYHDMGLIGAWLGTLYFGTPIAILSPLAFLARPARWLWTIHAHRGTLSPAPNFAFDLCVQKVTDQEIKGLDLSCLRILLNGSEPVMPDTIERFIQRFAPYGLKPEAMSPVYGLAECAVGLTMPPLNRPTRIDYVSRTQFQRNGRAEPTSKDEASPLRFVSCGLPLPDHSIRIVDDNGCPVQERVEGHVVFRGPSVTRGYFRNREATNKVLQPDGWMDSGDLGYLADSELFLTGRRKDIIIKAGRNIYPQEIEELTGSLLGVRKGNVAAFGLYDKNLGTERLIVVAETREKKLALLNQLQSTITRKLISLLGVPPDAVVLCSPGTVLKTSSGKIRRSAIRDAYAKGHLMNPRRSFLRQRANLLAQKIFSYIKNAFSQTNAFIFSCYMFTILLLMLPPLWIFLLMVPRGIKTHQLIRAWCRISLLLSGYRVRTEGLANLQNLKTVVLVVNHSSYLDVPVLLATLPINFKFIVKRRLASYPVLGTAIKKLGCIMVERLDSVDKRMSSANEVTEELRAETSLCIFPEGTFVRTPGLLPFRLGAFSAAVETGRPIVPITIRGMRKIFPLGNRLLRPGAITLSIHNPLTPKSTGWKEIIRLRDFARTQISESIRDDVEFDS